MAKRLDTLAKRLWDYHRLNQKLQKADAIIVLGSWDIRSAEWGTQLYQRQLAPVIVFSGHKGFYTKDWQQSEAEVFAKIARDRGVPDKDILVEDKSTNTGENIAFSLSLLKNKGYGAEKVILVHKPAMERRTYATFMKLAPERVAIVTSPPIEYKDYPNEITSKEQLINGMVGDLQRIIEYPKFGFQAYQEIPKSVLEAYMELIELGFNQKLIRRSDV